MPRSTKDKRSDSSARTGGARPQAAEAPEGPRTVALRIELGRNLLLPEVLASLEAGCVVELDRLADDGVELCAGGRRLARGEAVTVDGKFGVRVREVFAAAARGLRVSPPG